MNIVVTTNNSGGTSEIPGRAQNAAYCKYVASAGYNPVLAPMEADPEALAIMGDGLLLAGGIDIDPIYYGFSNICSTNVDPEKDDFERQLLHKFREYGKPIFGICRGFQLIFRELLFAHPEQALYNRYFEYLENVDRHSQATLSVARRFPSHQVRANIKSLLNDGSPRVTGILPVNSMHHQAVAVNFAKATRELYPAIAARKDLDKTEPSVLTIKDVELVAWTMRGVQQPTKSKLPDYDNYWTILEAAKINNWGAPIMGVQWHPEELKDIRPIRKFFGGDNKKVAVIGDI